jgi:cbb3-type cytochrome oxidase subunit 3
MKKIQLLSLFLFLLTAGACFALPAYAGPIDIGQNALSEWLNLSEKDPRIIVAELINVVIGFLALIFVILILYAGFLFMISGGNKEKTDYAKRAIGNAIIGLIIILSSWAITTFSIDAIINALK